MPVTFDDVKFGVEPGNFQLCEGVAAIDGVQTCGLRRGARFGSVGDGLLERVGSFRLPRRDSKRSCPPMYSRQAPPAINTPDKRFFAVMLVQVEEASRLAGLARKVARLLHRY